MLKTTKIKLSKHLGVTILLAMLLIECEVPQSNAATTYQPNWTSVNSHPAVPEWFKDAKFGIYFHWGAYSVPAYRDAWYPCMINLQGKRENVYHIAHYGDPSVWPYHFFINGANDVNGNWTKFEPKLKSAGGQWDPNEWAQLFADAGAKFAGPCAEHHDGYSMWNSAVNPWNAMSKTGLDVVGQISDAIRRQHLKLVVTLHTAANVTGHFYYTNVSNYAPAQSMASGDKNLQRLYATMSKSEEYQYWYDKNIELIDKYQPDFMWHDMGLPGIPDSWKQRYLAYYYNKAMDWGKEVVVSYKIYDPNSFGNGAGEIADYERGGPTNLASPYWMTDDSISKETWAYSKGMTYYSTKSVLHALIDKVSKNGNLLLNCAPMADAYEIKENFPLILKERKIMTTTTYNKTAVPLSGFLVATGLLVASAIALAGDAYPSVPIPDFKFADGPFKPDWDSLAKYRCPE